MDIKNIKDNYAKQLGIASRIASVLIPPLFIMVFLLRIYKQAGMYPYGDRSLSWCDMSQQVVPLLNQFKDILDGKSSMFLNFSDSGGMNFYGVFFFFLASPFTLLIKYVPKENMMMFMNVLVMLKLMTCALTSALCLNFTRKKLDPFSIILLSIMYPLCGYAMMYYQNVIWLDMMYLFPLLIMSLERLVKKQRPLMYIIVLSASMVVNYYIGYMVVVFILLFIGMFILRNYKTDNAGRVCRELFAGSLISALLTAVVWLPSLLQYISSGRGFTTVSETLKSSKIPTEYTTVFPMLMCLAFPIALLGSDLISRRRERSRYNDNWLIMLGLTLIPFFLEPVNKMWHTGNYMSFPCRYGYMTIFLMLYCSAYVLEQPPKQQESIPRYIIGAIFSMAAVYACFRYSYVTQQSNREDISRYAGTLWGNETSFRLILGIFLLTLTAYWVIHFFYARGAFAKNIFLGLSAIVFIVESITNTGIYMTYPAMNNEDTNKGQALAYELGGRVDTDAGEQGFTRMKSYSKVYNNNLIGAMGYNSISHYTSLNDRDYMETMKRWGYSGVWMETASVDGTRLSDAVLSIGYEINGGCSGSEEVYSGEAGYIHKLPQYLPMGILLEKGALDGCEQLPEQADRTAVQELISEKILGEQIIERYEPEEELYKSQGKYHFEAGDTLTYQLDIKGSREIYFDCYDGFSNHLSEPIFDSFTINVDGNVKCGSYPTAAKNGVCTLGEYTDCSVMVEITVQKTTDCSSLGLFGMDSAALDTLCKQAQGIGLVHEGGRLTGSVKLDEAKSCFISVPYNEGLIVKVNGKKTEYSRALSDFLVIELPEGENEISVSMIPRGFIPGVVITIIGACTLAVYLLLWKRNDRALTIDHAASAVMLLASAAAFIAVYVYPMAVYISALEDPPIL